MHSCTETKSHSILAKSYKIDVVNLLYIQCVTGFLDVHVEFGSDLLYIGQFMRYLNNKILFGETCGTEFILKLNF